MSQMSHCTQPTMYKFCFKIEIKTKADLYMPCEAMAHSTKFNVSTPLLCYNAFVARGPILMKSQDMIHRASTMKYDIVDYPFLCSYKACNFFSFGQSSRLYTYYLSQYRR